MLRPFRQNRQCFLFEFILGTAVATPGMIAVEPHLHARFGLADAWPASIVKVAGRGRAFWREAYSWVTASCSSRPIDDFAVEGVHLLQHGDFHARACRGRWPARNSATGSTDTRSPPPSRGRWRQQQAGRQRIAPATSARAVRPRRTGPGLDRLALQVAAQSSASSWAVDSRARAIWPSPSGRSFPGRAGRARSSGAAAAARLRAPGA